MVTTRIIFKIYTVCTIAGIISLFLIAIFKMTKMLKNKNGQDDSGDIVQDNNPAILKVPKSALTKSLQVHYFSPFSITGFFIVFGFMGYQTLNNQIQTYPSIIISILLGIAGLVIFALVGYAFDLLTKMDVVFSANTVGLYGLCLTEIKAKKGNVGKIRLTMNGKITEFDAVTYNEVTLSKGTSVKITNSLSDTCVVVEQG